MSLASLPISKRTACERCRGQKLRCPPGEDGTNACARCTRLGAACSFSYREPSGRVANCDNFAASRCKMSRLSSRTQSASSTSSASSNLAQSVPSSSQTRTGSPAPSSNGESLLSPSFQTTPTLLTMSDHIPRPAVDEELDFSHSFVFDSSDSTLFPTCDMTDMGDGFPMQNFHFIDPSIPDMNPFMLPPSMPGMDPTMGTDMPPQPSPVDSESRLLELALSLSNRYHQYLHSWGHPALHMQPSPHNRYMGDSLEHLSEFLSIIQSYYSTPAEPPHPSVFSYVAALNILSTYFRLVTIYDRVFGSLCIELNMGLEELHRLRLGGVESPLQQDLPVKMLIHAIMHQFETIERMLGLPSEYRVVSKADVFPGLLQRDSRLYVILEAITTGHASGVEHAELQSLASLRASISRVQAVVA